MSYGAYCCEADLRACLCISPCPHLIERDSASLHAGTFESFLGGCVQLETCLAGIKKCQDFMQDGN